MMRNQMRMIVCILAACLFFLGGCALGKGQTVGFDGFTVHTEKTREETVSDGPANRGMPESDGADFVLNQRSMKFHDPSCTGVSEISEANRVDYRGTRQSVLDMGYEPCKLCNP